MSFIKYWVRSFIYAFHLILGGVTYAFTKKTAPAAHLAMIMMFCRTRGYSSDVLSWIISLFRQPKPIIQSNSILPTTGSDEALTAVRSLKERGFYIFQNKLPTELCDELLKFATQHPALTRRMDGEVNEVVRIVYDREKPLAVRYDFSGKDLVDNVSVQKILADLSFAAIAQEYLHSVPILDIVGMWWHTGFSDRPDSEAAQFFHFDMDRPKWLKFFIYLTDVTTDNGPHFYVAGSHKTGAIPAKILDKGYSRLSDEEVEAQYTASDIIEFTAPRGTILAEDTRGLHKGKHVIHGDRLMFQIQFSNSLFGAASPVTKFSDQVSVELQGSIKRYPEVYSPFL